MRLSDLLYYNAITIQCHDNPDADAIASAFGLYSFFSKSNKKVDLIYSGSNEITKPNLLLMLEQFNIPLEYVEPDDRYIDGLLITVDCQYGQSNVTSFEADTVAIIDHHTVSSDDYDDDLTEIHSYMGSCSTLVWQLLKNERYPVNEDKYLATALYYGLMTDTSSFMEMDHPYDKDMYDEIAYDKNMVNKMIYSNISTSELDIASSALASTIYVPENRFAIAQTQPCDPNILGLVNDLILQVNIVDNCVVFNDAEFGYKISVRSCIKEVHANELAQFLVKEIGSGGGHTDKAGGFVSKALFEATYGDLSFEKYLKERMKKYYEQHEIIYASEDHTDTSSMIMYEELRIPSGYVNPASFIKRGTPITIRTLEGDINCVVDDDFYIIIGENGNIYPIEKKYFFSKYETINEPYIYGAEYSPTIIDSTDGIKYEIAHFAKKCCVIDDYYVRAKRLDKAVKLFTKWDSDNYVLGKPGDFIIYPEADLSEIYILKKDIFENTHKFAD